MNFRGTKKKKKKEKKKLIGELKGNNRSIKALHFYPLPSLDEKREDTGNGKMERGGEEKEGSRVY